MTDTDSKPPSEGGAGIRNRDPRSKLQHLAVCLSDSVEYSKPTGLECFEFSSQALPELALHQIELGTSLVGKALQAPLMIAPMTGGNPKSHEINQRLARAAERWQIAIGVGSQRIAVEDKTLARYFDLRCEAPTVPVFANLGGAQLVGGWGRDEARRAVDMIGADAIFIHINAMQEAIQDGDLDFSGLTGRIQTLCSEFHREGVPVFVREVGFGMSTEAARRLIDAGVAGIDCAGAGGTSWAKVEALCAKSERRQRMGQRFGEWGIPTRHSITNVRGIDGELPLIATGGLRTGTDIAKAIALGADIGSMARSFLVKAHEGEKALDQFISDLLTELRICMFCIGAANVEALKGSPHLHPLPLPHQ